MVTMVPRCTGGLSQLPVVKMSSGKKSKKKPSVLTNFHFLVNFIRHTGPMVTMVTRCTGGLSQLPEVEMSCRKKSKKKRSVLINFFFWSKPSVLTNFHFLVNFIRHTGSMVTRCTGSLTQLPVVKIGWGKNLRMRKNQVSCPTFIFRSISHWPNCHQVDYLSFQRLK